MVLLRQMLIFFCIMMLGLYAAKKGILDEKTSRSLSWLVVQVANPALVLTGCLDCEAVGRRELLLTGVLAFAIFFALMAAAWPFSILICREKEKRGIYQIMLTFSNMGFMGIPLISSIYGEEAVLYASVFLIPFNLLIYTWGIAGIRGRGGKGISWKRIVNPGLAAGILSVFICLMKLPVPDMAAGLIEMLGGMTAPLSMLIIGVSLAGVDPRTLLGRELILFSVCRLILFPVVGILALSALIENRLLLGVCFVVLASPAGSMAAILAKQYGGDEDTAVRGVTLTTLLSVVTMPVVFSLTGM